jgi:hypothetical protein
MSDIYQILIGLGVILSVVLFIIWYFRAPKGIGKTDPERPHTNMRINSSTPMRPESMNSVDKID